MANIASNVLNAVKNSVFGKTFMAAASPLTVLSERISNAFCFQGDIKKIAELTPERILTPEDQANLWKKMNDEWLANFYKRNTYHNPLAAFIANITNARMRKIVEERYSYTGVKFQEILAKETRKAPDIDEHYRRMPDGSLQRKVNGEWTTATVAEQEKVAQKGISVVRTHSASNMLFKANIDGVERELCYNEHFQLCDPQTKQPLHHDGLTSEFMTKKALLAQMQSAEDQNLVVWNTTKAEICKAIPDSKSVSQIFGNEPIEFGVFSSKAEYRQFLNENKHLAYAITTKDVNGQTVASIRFPIPYSPGISHNFNGVTWPPQGLEERAYALGGKEQVEERCIWLARRCFEEEKIDSQGNLIPNGRVWDSLSKKQQTRLQEIFSHMGGQNASASEKTQLLLKIRNDDDFCHTHRNEIFEKFIDGTNPAAILDGNGLIFAAQQVQAQERFTNSPAAINAIGSAILGSEYNHSDIPSQETAQRLVERLKIAINSNGGQMTPPIPDWLQNAIRQSKFDKGALIQTLDECGKERPQEALSEFMRTIAPHMAQPLYDPKKFNEQKDLILNHKNKAVSLNFFTSSDPGGRLVFNRELLAEVAYEKILNGSAERSFFEQHKEALLKEPGVKGQPPYRQLELIHEELIKNTCGNDSSTQGFAGSSPTSPMQRLCETSIYTSSQDTLNLQNIVRMPNGIHQALEGIRNPPNQAAASTGLTYWPYQSTKSNSPHQFTQKSIEMHAQATVQSGHGANGLTLAQTIDILNRGQTSPAAEQAVYNNRPGILKEIRQKAVSYFQSSP